MCQKVKDFNSLRGDICLDSRNSIMFIVDPHGLHTFPTVAKKITGYEFQEFSIFLYQLGAARGNGHSLCNIDVLKGLHDEFEQMKFCEKLAKMLEEMNITPEVPEVKAKSWFQRIKEGIKKA